MIKFRTNIYGFNKSDVIKFVNEVADEYESIYNKLKNATIQIESLNKELERYKDLEKTLNDTLLLAQETSANAQKAAYAQSKLIVEDAKNNADNIIQEAILEVQTYMDKIALYNKEATDSKKEVVDAVNNLLEKLDKYQQVELPQLFKED